MATEKKSPTCNAPSCDVEQGLASWGRGLWCRSHLAATIEDHARMARARLASGQRLSDLDRKAMAKFPNPRQVFT